MKVELDKKVLYLVAGLHGRVLTNVAFCFSCCVAGEGGRGIAFFNGLHVNDWLTSTQD